MSEHPDNPELGAKFDVRDGVITGPSGRMYELSDPVLPGKSDLLAEIAFGLGGVLRFNGRTKVRYCVGQHSVLVSRLLYSASRYGLIHDAAEAFLGDMPSPIKKLCPEFARLEGVWMRAIKRALQATDPQTPAQLEAVAVADRLALYVEVLAFDGGHDGARRLGFSDADIARNEAVLDVAAGASRRAALAVLQHGAWDRARASAEFISEYARVDTRRN